MAAGRALAVAAAALLSALPVHGAFAASLSGSGSMLRLSGPIVPGDAEAFRRFLAEVHPPRGAVLHLHSHGGKIREGVEIGRMVRAAGLATAVNARNAYCDSACTLIFVSGVRRFYSHGDEVFEGNSGLRGLGFHTAHRSGDGRAGNTHNPRGTDNMRAFYAEMGVPGAASLVGRAAFNTFFRPNGRTALGAGIATSLDEP